VTRRTTQSASRPRQKAERGLRKKATLEVDREALLELARGGNLYQTPFACLRELVQNAIDATLLRVFEERDAAAFQSHEGSLRELRALLASYPIDVSATRLADQGETQRYRVVVDDHGAGIRRSEVRYLQHIGSSRKNPRRARLIASMPEWMRPSGTFGIGLQSAFLVTDQIHIETRSLDGVASTIVIRAKNGGTIELRDGHRRQTGTRVEVDVSIAATKMRELLGGLRTLEAPVQATVSFDLLSQVPLAIVHDMARRSLVPLRVAGAPPLAPRIEDGAWFDADQCVELAVPAVDGADVVDHRRPLESSAHMLGVDVTTRMRYRGTPLENVHEQLLAGVTVSVDVHAGTAREMLLVGRDTWTESGRKDVRRRVSAALVRRVPALLASLDGSSPSLRAWLSAHALAIGSKDPGDAWREIVLATPIGSSALTLGEARDAGALFVHRRPRSPAGRGGFAPWADEISLTIDGPRGRGHWPTLGSLIHSLFPGREELGSHTARLTTAPGWSTCFERLACAVTEDQHWFDVRPLLSIPSELGLLCVPTAAVSELGLHDQRRDYLRDLMLSPWTFREDVVDVPHATRWVAWTARAGGPRRAKAAVARALIALLTKMDGPLRASSFRKVAYDLGAVIAEIERAYLR